MTEIVSKILEAALAYLRLGLCLVPIPYREKGPKTKDWQKLRLDEAGVHREFSQSPRNMGVLLGEPSGWLTDVDLDCREAVVLAPEFLPPTQRKSGRKSNPCSHFFYSCVGSKTKQFKDTKGDSLLEIRSTGAQTVLPPSIHCSGEPYTWFEEGDFTSVDWNALQNQTARLAATVQLARAWPSEGSRHKGALAIAGFFLRGGLSVECVKKIVGLAARTAGDEESASRITDVVTTAERLKANLPATGGPTAVDVFGGEVINKLSSWLNLQSEGDGGSKGDGGSTQTERLEEVAVREAVLWNTPDDKTYASFTMNGHRETWPIGSKRFRGWLHRIYKQEYRKNPNPKAVDDAVRRLEELALFEGDRTEVYVRLAGHEGAIYLDLGDEDWGVIKIDVEGWRLVQDAPVLFRRPKGMLPLPMPDTGGTIAELRPFLNYGSEENWILKISFLLAAFRPDGPFPVLVLSGEQGSAKSTVASVLRRLLDPSEAERRSHPRDVRDLFLAARNTWLLNFDNLSYLDSVLSDALCQLSTGGAMTTRALYTDDEEYIAKFLRPVILNGIDEFVIRPDLLERSITLNLQPIPEEDRQAEKTFWENFHRVAPRIIGAVLSVVSDALRRLPDVHLQKKPRMADFAIWATACEESLGFEEGAFMKAYNANREDANQLAITASPVAQAVLKFMSDKQSWKGSPTDLYTILSGLCGPETPTRAWPQNAQKLSDMIKRVSPSLKAMGIEVGRGKVDRNTRYISFRKVNN